MRFSKENKESRESYNKVKNGISMKNLEFIMHNYKITDKKLGSELDLSDSSIQGYRYGTKLPSLVSLIKLANYFNVNIDYLIDRTKISTKVDDLIKYDSDEFNNLVSKYCQLNNEDKSNVIGYINGLLESKKK